MNLNDANNAVRNAEVLAQDTGVHAREGDTAKGAPPILSSGLLSSRPEHPEGGSGSSIAMAPNKRVRGCQPRRTISKHRARLQLTIRPLKSTSRLNRVYAGSMPAEETNPEFWEYLTELYEARLAVAMRKDYLTTTFGKDSTELKELTLADQGSKSFAAAVTGTRNAYPEIWDDRYTL